MSKSILLLIAAIISSSCTSTTIYRPDPLPLPAEPELPRIAAEDLQCLSQDAYRRLVKRDRVRRQYAEKLAEIIKSTRSNKK